jgi:hypothetical protein
MKTTNDPFAWTARERAIFDAKRHRFLEFAQRLHTLGNELEDECRSFEDWCLEQFSGLINNGHEEDRANFIGTVPVYLRSAGRLIRDIVNHPLLGEELDEE